jgi:hypothetical protein
MNLKRKLSALEKGSSGAANFKNEFAIYCHLRGAWPLCPPPPKSAYAHNPTSSTPWTPWRSLVSTDWPYELQTDGPTAQRTADAAAFCGRSASCSPRVIGALGVR